MNGSGSVVTRKNKIYLAGAIEKSPDGGAGWRRKITPTLRDRLRMVVFDPCVETDGLLAKKLGWDEFCIKRWRELKETQPEKFVEIGRWIVREDLKAVEDSDIILVYFDKYVQMGAGTLGEITVAKYLNIPVYILVAPEFDVKDIPLWVTGCTTKVFEHKDHLIEYLEEQYYG